MVLLQEKTTKEKFYFHDMGDCEKFKRVFENHWCNLEWSAPEVADMFPGMTKDDIEDMDKHPKKRAEDDLSWGFAHQKDGLTSEQKAFVEMMLERV